MSANVIIGQYGFGSSAKTINQPLGLFSGSAPLSPSIASVGTAEVFNPGSVTLPGDTTPSALTQGVQSAITGIPLPSAIQFGVDGAAAQVSQDVALQQRLLDSSVADAERFGAIQTEQAQDLVDGFLQPRMAEFLAANPFAVRLKAVGNNKTVAFKVSPEINESRNNAYRTIDPVHMPGSIQVFTNSSPRSWNVSQIKLISRNGYEAEENLRIVNMLRSWMLPFFGETETAGFDGYDSLDLRGAPPEVLMFTAYSDHGETARGVTNIRNIPVVMTNLNIPYTTEVDYIETEYSKQPFPSIMSIDLNIVETHSPREYNKFDLLAFRYGRLEGF